MNIRMATKNDAEALLNIYKEYIETSITFETVLPSVAEFEQRIENTLSFYPYIVLEDNNTILGYAYAHRFRERKAYDYDVELSIYMAKNACGKGLGKKLYIKLFDLLKEMGVRNLCSCITTPNPKSEGLHEALGFRFVGEFKNSGYKNGKWLSVVWYEMAINDFDEPKALKSINEIDYENILTR